MPWAALILLSYLAGSIPFGLILARLIRGIDIRTEGSGNIGATNVSRSLGKKWGLVVLVLDALKGYLPPIFLPGLLGLGGDFAGGSEWALPMSAMTTVIGHMFPLWLGFRGGKGIATSLGALGAASPWGLLVATVFFFGSFAINKIVSLSSLIAVAAYLTFELVCWQVPFAFRNAEGLQGATTAQTIMALVLSALILYRHQANIARLRAGTEPRFFQKKAK
jgi:glycerol-3-phosphate acyltransferase PlsY